MKTRVRSHYRTRKYGLPSKVRSHDRSKPKRPITKSVYEVYDAIKDVYEFIHGSEEEKYNLALETALSMGSPYYKAIQIAARLMRS